MRFFRTLEVSVAGALLLSSYASASILLPRGQPRQPALSATHQDADSPAPETAKRVTEDNPIQPRACTAERLKNGGFDGDKPDPFVVTYAPELHFASVTDKDEPHVVAGDKAGRYLYAMFSEPGGNNASVSAQRAVRMTQKLAGMAAGDTYQCSGSFQAAVQSWRSNLMLGAIDARVQAVAYVGGVPCAVGSYEGAGIAMSTGGVWQEVRSLGRQRAGTDEPEFVLEVYAFQWGNSDPTWLFLGLDNVSVIGSNAC
ncbi:uncharacterized protein E0L32_000751 [Thyridium curvatum]|uniref:Uncharacterized protein n=1 Tax=Thyridium curvatum TaxID=1093900 RepID=A0A507B1I7_9PEZI|nr:uncharacterized protein E0L32_000751 [Thyridium curvatum]TPX12574.1 hypothetical protein E0L32_000751 [Thyridium curvatum]